MLVLICFTQLRNQSFDPFLSRCDPLKERIGIGKSNQNGMNIVKSVPKLYPGFRGKLQHNSHNHIS